MEGTKSIKHVKTIVIAKIRKDGRQLKVKRLVKILFLVTLVFYCYEYLMS